MKIKSFLSITLISVSLCSFKNLENKDLLLLKFSKEDVVLLEKSKTSSTEVKNLLSKKNVPIIEYSFKDLELRINYLDDYGNLSKKVLYTNNLDSFICDSYDFYNEFISTTNIFKQSVEFDSGIEPIGSQTIKVLEEPYGYMYFDLTASKYKFSEKASLYFLENNFMFVPGKLARKNGHTEYENYKRYKYSEEFVSMEAMQGEAEMGYDDIIYTGSPVLKDYYPTNSPRTITISSSYDEGWTIGTSGSAGFDSDGPSFEVGASEDSSYTFSYSKSYTQEDPSLTCSVAPRNNDLVEWRFLFREIIEEDGVDDPYLYFSHNGLLGYIFETNNFDEDRNCENEFDLVLNYEFELENETGNRHTIEGSKKVYWR